VPITTLDPTTALIVIDLQAGIVAVPLAHSTATIVDERSRALADAFRAQDLPVVLVNVAGTPPGRTEVPGHTGAFPDGWPDLVPELGQQPGDLTITKHTRGAFTNTGLEEQLRERGVTQVVLTGIATSAGVESTGRDAHERGFHVTFAVDAMTDRTADLHENRITTIFPRVGETGTTAEILALLTTPRS
jgi:nicotinamidase-related amidase